VKDNDGDALAAHLFQVIDRDPANWRKTTRANVSRHWLSIMIALVLGWIILGDPQGLITMALGASGALALVYFEPPALKTTYRRRVK
jgi:hypothetical protein